MYSFADLSFFLFVKIPHLFDLIIGLKFLQLVEFESITELEKLLLFVFLAFNFNSGWSFFDLFDKLGEFFLEVCFLLADINSLSLQFSDPFSQSVEVALSEQNGIAEVLLQSRPAIDLGVVFDLWEADRQADINLIDFKQFFLLIDLEFFLSCGQGSWDIFDLGVDLVSLLLQITLLFWVFFYLLVILADLSHSFEVLVVVFNHCNVWLFVFIFEFILTLLTFLFFFLFLVLILACLFVLFLLLLELGLFLHLVDSLSLSDLVVSDDSFAHVIVIRIDKFTQNLLLFFVFSLEFFVEDLHFANVSA